MSLNSNAFSKHQKASNRTLEYFLFLCGGALLIMVFIVTINWKFAFLKSLYFWFDCSFVNFLGMFAVSYFAFICIVSSQVLHFEYITDRVFGSVELFLTPFLWTCSLALLVLSISQFPMSFQIREFVSLKTLFSMMLFSAFLLFGYSAFKLMNDPELTTKIPNLRKV